MESQNPVIRMDYFSGLVEKAIEGSSAVITGDGSKFQAQVVSEAFDGLSKVKRHQLVYGALQEHIKSGAIHALTISAMTPAEAEAAAD